MNTYQSRPRDEIAERIECYIIEHQLKPGDRLPSERQLCEAWNCNRMTFRAAAKRLIAEGILTNVPMVGYFIAEEKLERYLQDLSSFTEFVENKGLHLANRLISQSILPASRRNAQLLNIPEGGPIFELIRLRLVDNIPISLETVYIPMSLFAGIEQYDFAKESLYAVMEKKYGVVFDRGSEEISITYADSNEANLLQIEEGDPLFYLKGFTSDVNGNPVEVIKAVLRTDKIRFAGELRKE